MANTKNKISARLALDKALRLLCEDLNNGHFSPILEADVAAYLYYRLVTSGCSTRSVYMATRVCGEAAKSRKPDIVIGALCKEDACVSPELICELKVFQRWGHSEQQLRHRMSGVLAEDLPTLEQAREVLNKGRIEILVDLFVSSRRRGYLSGFWDGRRRIDVIQDECERIGASLIWVHPAVDQDGVVCETIIM